MSELDKRAESLERTVDKILGALSKILPAIFLYLMNLSKKKSDSLKSELDLRNAELKAEKAKEAVSIENAKKSSISIVDDFIK